MGLGPGGAPDRSPRFNGGFAAREIPVPQGRLNYFHLRRRSISRHAYSTHAHRLIPRTRLVSWQATITGPYRTLNRKPLGSVTGNNRLSPVAGRIRTRTRAKARRRKSEIRHLASKAASPRLLPKASGQCRSWSGGSAHRRALRALLSTGSSESLPRLRA